jgi:uncharacterized protein with von Willebrand factor type A (vWA) domain
MLEIRRLYQEKDTVINTDTFDRERFVQLAELSPKLGEIVQKQVKENREYPSLMGDMWASLYKMKPSIKEYEDGEGPKSKINHQFMQRIFEDENFEQLRKSTTLDDFSSAIGSMRLNEKVHEWMEQQKAENEELKKLMQELLEKQKQMESQQKKQHQAEQRQQDAQNNGDEKEQKKADSQAKKEQKKTESLNNELSDLQSQIQQQLADAMNGSSSNNFSQAIQSASKETQQSKDDLQNLLSGGTGASGGEGEMKKIPLREQISLAETLRNNKQMKEIAEWAGKFKSIARKKQKSKHVDSLDRSGMTIGNDVERLLPQELGLLVNKNAKLDFLRRFAEGQTMMYSPKGKETLGKGPIVICLDQSGSMKHLDPQSKGFILALAMIAKKQRRDFAVVTFSNKVGKVFSFEKGKISPTGLVELAEFFQGGGTNYTPALEKAKELILNEKPFRKADIVFVTDGEPSDIGLLTNEKWVEGMKNFKKNRQTSIISLLVGGYKTTKWLENFSDKIVLAADFNSENSHDVLAIKNINGGWLLWN